MYHPDDHNIITTDDISHLREAVLHVQGEKTTAILHVELFPTKNYTTEGLKLHLTNGVSHRYLMVEPEEEVVEEAAETEAKTEAEALPGAAESLNEGTIEEVETEPEAGIEAGQGAEADVVAPATKVSHRKK
jgi:hypothetical protein